VCIRETRERRDSSLCVLCRSNVVRATAEKSRRSWQRRLEDVCNLSRVCTREVGARGCGLRLEQRHDKQRGWCEVELHTRDRRRESCNEVAEGGTLTRASCRRLKSPALENSVRLNDEKAWHGVCGDSDSHDERDDVREHREQRRMSGCVNFRGRERFSRFSQESCCVFVECRGVLECCNVRAELVERLGVNCAVPFPVPVRVNGVERQMFACVFRIFGKRRDECVTKCG